MQRIEKDLPILSHTTAQAWNAWLVEQYAVSNGVWLRLYRKNSDTKTISYAEALDEALCFGWIDGQKNKYDEESWLQYFTPRRPKSMWSKGNTVHVERLIKENRMQPAGLREVEAAKVDGRWDAAYDSPKDMTVPVDFLQELQKDQRAYAFFKTLNKANTYAIAWRLRTAKKPETLEKRTKMILAMLARGEKFH